MSDKILPCLLAVVGLAWPVVAEDLYDPHVLRTISLQFAQQDWWARLVANYQSKTNLPATMVCDGRSYEGVGVRFRGNTSYTMTGSSQKKSFNIEVDYTIAGQRLMGYKTLNLLNCANDPTFMREVLYTNVCRQQIPSAKANFVRLQINGQDWGIYANVQQLNAQFIRDWFLSNEGTMWRAEGMMGNLPGATNPTAPTIPTNPTVPPRLELNEQIFVGEVGGGLGGGVTNGAAALTWQGIDVATYQRAYELKGTHQQNPWASLIHACDVLNNSPVLDLPNVLDKVLNVDRALWVCAFEIVFADHDGYVYKRGSDYYLYYEPETGRIHLIQYDGNECLTGSPTAWPLLYRSDDPLVPVMYKLMAINQYRQRYLAHVRTILEDYFTEDMLYPVIDTYRAMIDPYVKLDTKKLYTYQQFVTGVEGLKSFIRQRRAYLLSSRELVQQPPQILSVDLQQTSGESGPVLTISARVSQEVAVGQVNCFVASGPFAIFEPLAMAKVGQDQQDRADIYAVILPTYPSGTVIRYYIQAIAANVAQTTAFSPPGAEYHFYSYRYDYPSRPSSAVVINELMAANTCTIADPQGQFDDWIELFNSSDQPTDLSGMYLSDDPDRPLKWRIPDGTILGPKGFLLIWADEDGEDTGGLHANFKLSASGEAVWLFDCAKNGHILLDYVGFDILRRDQSIGRVPDGVGTIQVLQTPSPGWTNGP